MSYEYATFLSLSATMGKLRVFPLISLMSLAQPSWLSTVLALRPSSLTPRLLNSGSRRAISPSSVVQTGVKSSGWEKKTTQLSPMYSCRSIGPLVVSALKLGATVPRRRLDDA